MTKRTLIRCARQNSAKDMFLTKILTRNDVFRIGWVSSDPIFKQDWLTNGRTVRQITQKSKREDKKIFEMTIDCNDQIIIFTDENDSSEKITVYDIFGGQKLRINRTQIHNALNKHLYALDDENDFSGLDELCSIAASIFRCWMRKEPIVENSPLLTENEVKGVYVPVFDDLITKETNQYIKKMLDLLDDEKNLTVRSNMLMNNERQRDFSVIKDIYNMILLLNRIKTTKKINLEQFLFIHNVNNSTFITKDIKTNENIKLKSYCIIIKYDEELEQQCKKLLDTWMKDTVMSDVPAIKIYNTLKIKFFTDYDLYQLVYDLFKKIIGGK